MLHVRHKHPPPPPKKKTRQRLPHLIRLLLSDMPGSLLYAGL